MYAKAVRVTGHVQPCASCECIPLAAVLVGLRKGEILLCRECAGELLGALMGAALREFEATGKANRPT